MDTFVAASARGVRRIAAGAVTTLGALPDGQAVTALADDGSGGLFVAGGPHLFQLRGSALTPLPVRSPVRAAGRARRARSALDRRCGRAPRPTAGRRGDDDDRGKAATRASSTGRFLEACFGTLGDATIDGNDDLVVLDGNWVRKITADRVVTIAGRDQNAPDTRTP
ncbi:MAG: hypothetical protein U0414_26300 [Polyangiaceae bacterium]